MQGQFIFYTEHKPIIAAGIHTFRGWGGGPGGEMDMDVTALIRSPQCAQPQQDPGPTPPTPLSRQTTVRLITSGGVSAQQGPSISDARAEG